MTTPTCTWEGCTVDALTRGQCGPHYRRRLHTGRYGYQDGAPAREHVLALRALGWTYGTISEVAKISTFVPHKLASGATRRVLRETEEKILALPLTPVPSTRGVDGTGTYRRLEALQWLGWPMSVIGADLGLKTYSLTTMRGRGEPVSFRIAQAAVVLFEKYAHIPGPSKQTATKAQQKGWSPPLAWDDDTIDDPTAKPNVGKFRRLTHDDAVAEYRHLHQLGLSDNQIGVKLGLVPRSINVIRLDAEKATA